RGGFDAGDQAEFGMTAQYAVVLAKRGQRVGREESLVGQDRVERQAAMALAEDATVPVRPARLRGAHVEDVVIEHAHDLDQGHGRPEMPSPGRNNGLYDCASKYLGASVERPRYRLEWRPCCLHRRCRASNSRAFPSCLACAVVCAA